MAQPGRKTCPYCGLEIIVRHYRRHLITHRSKVGGRYRSIHGPRSIAINDEQTKQQMVAVHQALGCDTYIETLQAIIEAAFLDNNCSYPEDC